MNKRKIDLSLYDRIVISSSAGKDSLAMLHYVVGLADSEGVSRERIVVVHADLGRAEWKGTRDLAKKQADLYGLEFRAVSRKQDLLDQVRARKKWPSSAARYCTSDHKRDQVAKVFTGLAREKNLGRAARVLNCMGHRAQESTARAKMVEFENDKRATGKGTRKVVDIWRPILSWTESQVWASIRENGLPYHPAYDLGMPRLSCVFCVFAPKAALKIAAKNNPDLFKEYCQIEDEIEHDFRDGFRINDIFRKGD